MYNAGRHNRNIKIGAAFMFSALTLFFLYLADIVPAGRIALYFVCSVFIMGIMVEQMPVAAFASFASVFFVGYLILPDKAGMLPYLFFFGHYGIFKAYVDGGGVKGLLLKLLYFNAGMALVYFFGGRYLTQLLPFRVQIWMVWAIGNGVFLLYDFLFSKLTEAYAGKMRGHLLGLSRW